MEFTLEDKNKFYSYEDFNFTMPMSYFEGKEINNELALNRRFCFILIEKGAGIAQINDKNIHFIAPTVFCINETENIIIDKKLNCDIKAIYFHPSAINGALNFDNIRNYAEDFTTSTIQDCYWNKCFIERDDIYNGKVSIGPITYKRIEFLFDDFKKESSLQTKAYWPCRVISYVMEILFLIEKLYSENDLSSADFIGEVDDELYSILIYILNNYNKKITIPTLTKEFNINRTTLSEKFNKFIGETIISYLNKLRIKMASVMLKDTLLPVSEVMERVGFNDSTHFSRTFKKYMGISPSEFRDSTYSL